MLGLWKKHAPNLAEAVIDSFTRSPLDVERTLPNMREGDLLIGALTDGHRLGAAAGGRAIGPNINTRQGTGVVDATSMRPCSVPRWVISLGSCRAAGTSPPAGSLGGLTSGSTNNELG
jgi:hypothetical protein